MGSGYAPTHYQRGQSDARNVDVNGFLRGKLREIDSRDTEAIHRHIDNLRDALEDDAEDVISTALWWFNQAVTHTLTV